jgi:hypothetical protein
MTTVKVRRNDTATKTSTITLGSDQFTVGRAHRNRELAMMDLRNIEDLYYGVKLNPEQTSDSSWIVVASIRPALQSDNYVVVESLKGGGWYIRNVAGETVSSGYLTKLDAHMAMPDVVRNARRPRPIGLEVDMSLAQVAGTVLVDGLHRPVIAAAFLPARPGYLNAHVVVYHSSGAVDAHTVPADDRQYVVAELHHDSSGLLKTYLTNGAYDLTFPQAMEEFTRRLKRG